MTTTEPTADSEVELAWRRLNARMILVHPIHELVRAIPAILIALVAGADTGNHEWWSLVVSGFAVIPGPIRWYTTMFRVTDEQVQIRWGYPQKRVTTIPRDRIRAVDVTASPLHRVLGLARVIIGTGSAEHKRNEEGGVKLDALTANEALRLRDELFPDLMDNSAQGVELLRLKPSWVRYGPCHVSPSTAIILVFFLSSQIFALRINLSTWAPTAWMWRAATGSRPWVGVVEFVLVAVALAAIASTLGYLTTFWNFRLVRRPGGTLEVAHGLMSIRRVTMQELRIRGVEVTEPLLLRAAGTASATAITTGLKPGRGVKRLDSLIAPGVPRAEAVRVAGEVLADPAAVESDLVKHGRRARRRTFTRVIPWVLLLNIALFALAGRGLLQVWLALLSLVLLPTGIWLALDRYRSLGHRLGTELLIGGSGSLTRQRWALQRTGITGWNFRRSFFQRRLGLTTLVATTAAGKQRYRLPDLDFQDAVALTDEATPGLLAPFLRCKPGGLEGGGRLQSGE